MSNHGQPTTHPLLISLPDMFLLLCSIKQSRSTSSVRISGWNCHLLIILFWALKTLTQLTVAVEEGLCGFGRSFEAPEGKVTLSQVSQGCVVVLFGKLERSLTKFASSKILTGGTSSTAETRIQTDFDKMQKCSKSINSMFNWDNIKAPCSWKTVLSCTDANLGMINKVKILQKKS